MIFLQIQVEVCKTDVHRYCEKFSNIFPFPVEEQNCHFEPKKICELEMKTCPKKAKKYSYTKDCKEKPKELSDQCKKNIIVFDLGGGTFDVSFLTIDNRVFKVASTKGDTHLRGEDFDRHVMEHSIKLYKKKKGKDLRKDVRAVQKVLGDATLTKKGIDEIVPVGGSTKIPTVQSQFGGYPRGRNQEQKGEMGDKRSFLILCLV